MSEHSNESTSWAMNAGDDLVLLNRMIECLLPLDEESKLRLLRSTITFLKLDAHFASKSISNQTSVATGAGQIGGTSFSDRTEMSPKQFLNEKQPATDIDRVACLAYYLTHYRNTPEFKTIDISKLNTEAAQPKFSNPSVPVDNATRRGFLVATSGGNKQLGAVGEQFVQALPDRDAAKAVLSRVRIRKPRKKSSGSNAKSEEES
jgi:hypothetical protein